MDREREEGREEGSRQDYRTLFLNILWRNRALPGERSALKSFSEPGPRSRQSFINELSVGSHKNILCQKNMDH